MATPVVEATSSIPSLTKIGKLTEKEENMLKIAQTKNAVDEINWAEFNPRKEH